MRDSADSVRRTLKIDPRVKSFYEIAAKLDDVDVSEISPSFSSLQDNAKRYESPVMIAKGGMKRIFRVYDTCVKRPLALAELHQDAPKTQFDPFVQEAWLTAQLDHPNIMTIHDVGIDVHGRPYFTMDLKTGRSLQDFVIESERPNQEDFQQHELVEGLDIFIKICDAVAYAHSRGVLHLDLKPANIQVGDFGEVLLCDWGLGRVLPRDEEREEDIADSHHRMLNPDLLDSVNLFGERKGTLGYMAPEQFEQDGQVGVSTDIYGLGGILYAILAARAPLAGTIEEIAARTVSGGIVPPSNVRVDRQIPKSLDAVVMRALATEPEQRYASVDELRDEVRRYLTGFATQAENAALLTQLHIFYRRNKGFCLTVASGVVIFLGATGVAFDLLNKKENAAVEARSLAQQNAQSAKSMRVKAEQTLDLYRAGQKDLSDMTLQNANSVVAVAGRYLLQGNLTRSQSLLESALAQEPDNQTYQRAMGITCFAAQRFNESLGHFERGVHPNDRVCNIAKDFAARKTDDTKLSADQVVEILHRLTDHEALELQVVINDRSTRNDLIERARIVEEYLHTLNPDWKDGWFEYDPAASRLRVGGTNLRRLASERSVLVGLQPRELDVSTSDIVSLAHESSYAIESLDIRNTPMLKIGFIRRFVFLKRLIISPNQLSRQRLSFLPEHVTVIEKDDLRD